MQKSTEDSSKPFAWAPSIDISKIPKPPKPKPISWNDFDRAARLYVDGHYPEALDLLKRIYKVKLTDEQNRRLRFLAGLTAYRLGLHEEIEYWLAGENKAPESLRPYTLFFLGQAAYWAERPDEARDLLAEYAKVDPGGPFVLEAELTRVRALYDNGSKEEALKEGRDLAKHDKSGAAYLLMAQMYEGMGRKSRARSNYKQAMLDSKTRAVRAEAAHKYAELLAPVLDEEGNEAGKLEYIKFLRREWRLEKGLAAIDKLLAAGASAGLTSSLKSEKARFLYYSGQVERSLPYQGDNNNLYVRSLKRMGDWKKAADQYLAAAKSGGRSLKADKARYEAAIIYLRMDKPEEALKIWEQIGERNRNGRLKDDWLWHLGFYYYGKKEYKNAAKQFKQMVEETKKSKNWVAAHYWLGRSLEQDGRAKEAEPYYKKLASGNKELYYRMRAEQRLGWVTKHDHWPDLPIFKRFLTLQRPDFDYSYLPLANHKTDSVGRPHWAFTDANWGDLWRERARASAFGNLDGLPGRLKGIAERIRELSAAGAMDLAHEEADRFRAVAKSTGVGGSNGYQIKTRLFGLSSAYLAETGHYRDFVILQYRHYRTLMAGKQHADRQITMRRVYPLAYPDSVLKASKEFYLHPALILAIMRTESYYNPNILSYANARGLMQILPSTGRKIAALMNEPDPLVETLFDPETNIRYGAWYLSALTREFDGQYPLAIASYNGGPFNVKRWVEQNEGASMEEFIEAIPFDQTRLYVKKVLGAMYQYRKLYSGKALGPDLTVPVRNVIKGDINF